MPRAIPEGRRQRSGRHHRRGARRRGSVALVVDDACRSTPGYVSLVPDIPPLRQPMPLKLERAGIERLLDVRARCSATSTRRRWRCSRPSPRRSRARSRRHGCFARPAQARSAGPAEPRQSHHHLHRRLGGADEAHGLRDSPAARLRRRGARLIDADHRVCCGPPTPSCPTTCRSARLAGRCGHYGVGLCAPARACSCRRAAAGRLRLGSGIDPLRECAAAQEPQRDHRLPRRGHYRDRGFDQHDMMLLDTLADHIAQAIENA